jgi:hypothetical protein
MTRILSEAVQASSIASGIDEFNSRRYRQAKHDFSVLQLPAKARRVAPTARNAAGATKPGASRRDNDLVSAEFASLRCSTSAGPGRGITSPKASLQRYVARAVEVLRGRDRRRCATGDDFPRRRVNAGPQGPRRRTGSATRYAPATRATSRGGRDPRGAACERSQVLRAQGASRRRASRFERHRLRRRLVRPRAMVTAAESPRGALESDTAGSKLPVYTQKPS